MPNVQSGEPAMGSQGASTTAVSSNQNITSVEEQQQQPQQKTATTSAPVSVRSTCDKPSSASFKSDEQSVIHKRSESRDSVNDDPKSIGDSISAISGRNNWSSIRDIAEYDPSINSIKGDSVSATIADYNRKHDRTAAILDNQSRASCLDSEPSSAAKNDNFSVNMNYYAVSSSSTSGPAVSSRHINGVHNDNSNQNHHQARCIRDKGERNGNVPVEAL